MNKIFDHEKLRVYQASIKLIIWFEMILKIIPKKHCVHNQLDRASTSITLNIAEGNGKSSPRDRCRFFDIARGSALECTAALDVLVAKGILKDQDIIEGKQILREIVSMIIGFKKINHLNRICEVPVKYGYYYDYYYD